MRANAVSDDVHIADDVESVGASNEGHPVLGAKHNGKYATCLRVELVPYTLEMDRLSTDATL